MRVAVLVPEVSRLGERGQSLDHTAIDGGQHLADILLAEPREGGTSAQSSAIIASSRSAASKTSTASDNDPKEVLPEPADL